MVQTYDNSGIVSLIKVLNLDITSSRLEHHVGMVSQASESASLSPATLQLEGPRRSDAGCGSSSLSSNPQARPLRADRHGDSDLLSEKGPLHCYGDNGHASEPGPASEILLVLCILRVCPAPAEC